MQTEGGAPTKEGELRKSGKGDHGSVRQGTRRGLMPRAGTWTSARGQGTTKAKEENLPSRAIRRPSNSTPPCSLQDCFLLHTAVYEAPGRALLGLALTQGQLPRWR